MNARAAREMFGPALIGRFITTEAIGEYHGGRAKVVELDPDPEAPEIVMTVKHPTWRSEIYSSDGTMGIFEYEEVYL